MLGLNSHGLRAEILKDIQKRKTIRVGVKNNLPLLGQVDKNGDLTGFEIDLARSISNEIWGEETVQVELISLLNQNRLMAIANGSVDIAIANIHVTEPRRRVVAFSQPYLESQTRFVSRNPDDLENINNGIIGVLQGSVAIGRLRSAFPNAQLMGLNSYQEAIQNLNSGQIDIFAGDRFILRGWQVGASMGMNIGPSVPSLGKLNYSNDGIGLSQIAIAMPKGLQHQNLHQAIDLALNTLESSGQLQQMRNKWRLSEADATAVVRLEKSWLLMSSMAPRANKSPNVLSTCCHGSIINFSLFDSSAGVARSCRRLCLSTSSQDSSR